MDTTKTVQHRHNIGDGSYLSMKKDRIMVNAGEEKKMAVQSPRGTLHNIPASRKLPTSPETWPRPQNTWPRPRR